MTSKQKDHKRRRVQPIVDNVQLPMGTMESKQNESQMKPSTIVIETHDPGTVNSGIMNSTGQDTLTAG